MAQPDSGIGNVTPNAALVQMAMAYSRSRVLCAAARLGVADALGDEVRSIDHLAEACQADADALYRLLRALASVGVTEETAPKYFRLTPFGRPLRRDVPQSAWPAVVFWADLLADSWSLLRYFHVPNGKAETISALVEKDIDPWIDRIYTDQAAVYDFALNQSLSKRAPHSESLYPVDCSRFQDSHEHSRVFILSIEAWIDWQLSPRLYQASATLSE
jgi:hypothetical protein